MPPAPDISHVIGNTPLVRLDRFAAGLGHTLLGKCEFMNPGGSVKDRIAFAMVGDAERRGLLRPGGTIVEATAGNTGLGLAMAAALKGYRLIVVMTTKTSADKVELMRSVGARVVIVPREHPPTHPDHFMNTARRIAAATPDAWWADQFANPANLAVHYQTTAREIWEQTDGRIDAFIAGVGTGGTLSGVARFLKERNPAVRIILADPIGSILAGLVNDGAPTPEAAYIVEGMGTNVVPANAELHRVDRAIRVSDAETVIATRALFEREGIFAGGSSGCILAAAQRYAREASESGATGLTIVAMLPDGGRGYLTTIHNREWREANGFEASRGDGL